MTTIIATGGALGNHRCDARCHEGRADTACVCICGGRYHAVGSSDDAQRMLTEDWLDGRLEVEPTARLRLAKVVQGSLLNDVDHTGDVDERRERQRCSS